jgi:hypothetical protein
MNTKLLKELARELAEKDVVRNIITYDDPDWGCVYTIEVDLNAKEALELWLKLVKQIPYDKYNVIIGVKWLGENNITEEELINYVVKIMVESGIKPKALKPFNAVEELQEERRKR